MESHLRRDSLPPYFHLAVRFCSYDMTKNILRGTYQWQETAGGGMHQPLPCMYGDNGVVVRNCTEEGIWEDPDLSQCITMIEVIESVS